MSGQQPNTRRRLVLGSLALGLGAVTKARTALGQVGPTPTPISTPTPTPPPPTPTPFPTPTPTPVSTPTQTPSPTVTPPCFRAGTRILTARGEIAVEDLVVGDTTIAPDGATAVIRWIGWRQLDLTRLTNREQLWPIRIQRGAIGEGIPRRDLFVSPDHALFLGGVLIPAGALVNGATVSQSRDLKQIRYYHIELENYGLLLAEGVATESYIDSGTRSFFANAPEPALHPVFPMTIPRRWLPRRVARALDVVAGVRFERACAPAPRAVGGRPVKRVRRELALRAQVMGYALIRDPDLALLADDRIIRPYATAGRDACFLVPPGVRRLRLLSRTAVAAETGGWFGDRRRLGVAVSRLVFDIENRQRVVTARNPVLDRGFYPPERKGLRARRWTDGAAELPHLPAAAPITLTVRLAGSPEYWIAPELPARTAQRA